MDKHTEKIMLIKDLLKDVEKCLRKSKLFEAKIGFKVIAKVATSESKLLQKEIDRKFDREIKIIKRTKDENDSGN